MIGALWTGISGLASQQTALDNESHNIANVNTVGYKASRISFADQMYQNKIGKGSQVQDAEKMYKQGNLKVTGVNYDMALSGDGFFAVSNSSAGGTSETYYTRAGNFRMGDAGTLQDTIGNDVQGWAMANEPHVETSNPNVKVFTNDYTKMLSSKIIKYSSAIETITAKSTDFTQTAKGDSDAIYTGAGLKSQSSKVADIEELMKSYTAKLQALKDNPNSPRASATNQKNHLELPENGSNDAVSQDGDEVYVYIAGNRISQPYITGTGATDDEAIADGYRKTMKAFADKISELPGMKAYVADDDPSYTPSTKDDDVTKGYIKIESLVPGKQFTISSTGMVHAGNDKPGTSTVDVVAKEGQGLGAYESARDALNMAITGKQRDVYTTIDLDNPDGAKDYTYGITIYDKSLEKNIAVPDTNNDGEIDPITITDPSSVDDFVDAINNDVNLQSYIKAENINGALVIKTTNSNFDVEYSGELKEVDDGNGALSPALDIKKNSDYSGREGAGAEFMEIKTRIDQTSTRGAMQLRLDSLKISDSAFGDFSVDKTGLITMKQDGATYAVGQVAIAKFITNRGLDPIGNNLLQKTLASGDPIYNLNNNKTAEIQSNTLELSTADLSESLVNLMVFQRAFEANAKSITTADTILNTLIQLKR